MRAFVRGAPRGARLGRVGFAAKWLARAAGALFVIALSSPAFADGYIVSHAMWAHMSEAERIGYAMGAMDEILTPYQWGRPSGDPLRDGYAKCIVARQLKGADLAAMVSDGYRASADLSTTSPSKILRQQLFMVCRDYIPQGQQPSQ